MIDDDLPLVRETCATRLAEAAHLGVEKERAALLRCSYYLSPDPEEAPHPAPTAAELALGARKLRELRGIVERAGVRAHSAGQLAVEMQLRATTMRVLEQGALLLERVI